MTTFTVEELPIPTTPDDLDFMAATGVRNTGLAQRIGDAASLTTPAEGLPYLQDQQYDGKRMYVARVGDTVVGSALMVWPLASGSRLTFVNIDVLAEWRNQGIGSALLDTIETESRAAARPVIQSDVIHGVQAGEMLPSPTGFGALPRHEAGVRFLLAHGFHLEQVYRVSTLRLPVDEVVLTSLEAESSARAGSAYQTHVWTGVTPERWRSDLATIFARMSTDAPWGNLEVEPDPWDAERVRTIDERRLRAGRLPFVAAVEHVPTGSLVAYNGLSVSAADRARPAQQGITLVLKEHRGHRLGMRTKVANIRQLMAASPATPLIITDNAEENRPMLDVNEAVGFQSVAYQGAWQKTLT